MNGYSPESLSGVTHVRRAVSNNQYERNRKFFLTLTEGWREDVSCANKVTFQNILFAFHTVWESVHLVHGKMGCLMSTGHLGLWLADFGTPVRSGRGQVLCYNFSQNSVVRLRVGVGKKTRALFMPALIARPPGELRSSCSADRFVPL